MTNENTVYLSIGSNMGDRLSFLKYAAKSMKEDVNISITRYSSIYETAPIGYTDQDNFLNMVIELKTSYSPLQLLSRTQKIQDNAGREYNIRWGPRTLDLDILLYNQENIKMEQLIVPHPRMFERSFVIIPLREVNPVLYFPSIEKSIDAVYEELRDKEGVYLWKKPFGEEEFEHSES
ncbi:2-amino-4-hydroxy-6-hydroxymethyldihydropteridine diphosphokinase [Anaerobacillus alkalidiazotrophicus]|uniref:2-amino-4-hydroxy-6-hydroxymethyldihydropteridine diphosphokinase n=1 Tax=Anaerobacillus alkalidiazotrophicus TaxID=472963 RepID=A0A1S2M9Z2_9BACI|nr:2-amino-4-hydroxy-6-hydroxymethyldihydropteridine diphosphokinase [Anaerobacillus alkalidiazotrophicus]OIJ20495.1 2-amino-4-hydroxy-6-hydroxymethyldihydropteridine diphosphokinase [Anaerobacillus alkalidiazotrophicus]